MCTLLFDENKPETRRQAAILWGERADVAATQRRQRRPRRCRTSWAVVETVEAEPQRRVRTLPLVSRRLWDIRRPGVAVWRPFGPASDASRQHRCRPSKRNLGICGVNEASREKTVSSACRAFHAQISRMALHALVAQAPLSRCVLFRSPTTTAHLLKKSRTNDEAKSRAVEQSERCREAQSMHTSAS
jgi:hypothetical protein